MRALLLLSALALAACKEEARPYLDPVAMSAEAVGHFCQMGILEHEGPKAQVHLEGLPGVPLFFSQVRDAVAYTRLPEQTHVILAIYVSDMGAEGASWANPGAMNWTPLKDAALVVGSERDGGMGTPELVPFTDPDAAEAFAARYGGAVMGVENVPDAAVIAPLVDDNDVESDSEFEDRLNALARSREG